MIEFCTNALNWKKIICAIYSVRKTFLSNNVFAVQIAQNNIKDAVHTTETYKHIPKRFSFRGIVIKYRIVFIVKL